MTKPDGNMPDWVWELWLDKIRALFDWRKEPFSLDKISFEGLSLSPLSATVRVIIRWADEPPIRVSTTVYEAEYRHNSLIPHQQEAG